MAIPSPSDGRETRPYRASISASATTWRRSHLALSLESRDGTVSAEAVVRPDATALSVRGDVVVDDDDDDDDDFIASTLVFGGGGGGACVDDAPPAAVRVRVTGPIATVHWVSNLARRRGRAAADVLLLRRRVHRVERGRRRGRRRRR
jgi:hypothetical protein